MDQGPDVEAVVSAIRQARLARRCLPARQTDQAISVSDAYLIQGRLTQARLDRGERIAGWKLGYTSEAMRQQMGVREPNHGPLTDAMLLADGAEIVGDVIHPRVEPEVAVILGADVDATASLEDVLAAVAQMRCCLEVVDSVWCDYRFTWADNTADGSSAAYVVLGPELDIERARVVDVVLSRNGDECGRGSAAAAMGDPIEAVRWLAAQRPMGRDALRAGEVVITGGLTAAVPLEPGDRVVAHFGGLTVAVSRIDGDGDERLSG